MVRIQIDTPVISSRQLETVARLSREYGNGLVHVTAGQNLQIPEIPLESVSEVLEGLCEAGLSAEGGEEGTVRNVTSCSRAGSCLRERFNVAPYAEALTVYLWQFDRTCHPLGGLKIAFSGCPSDCALASVADLGFFAQLKEGVRGFAVRAGGGLGPPPAVGIQIEDFVPADEVLDVAEAMKRLVRKHGERLQTDEARLRCIVEHLGPSEFVRCYAEERAKIRDEGLDCNVLKAAGKTQRTKDESLDCTQSVRLPSGDISAEDLIKMAQEADQ